MRINPNHYDFLGITGLVTGDVIRDRIARERARIEILKRIPAKRAEVERLSAELEQAAAVLLDPEARKRYDESLAKTNAPATEGGVFRHAVKQDGQELPPAAPAAAEAHLVQGQATNTHAQAAAQSSEMHLSAPATNPGSTTGAAPARAVRRARPQEFPGHARPDDAPPTTSVSPPPVTQAPFIAGTQPPLKLDREELWRTDTPAATGSDAGLHLIAAPATVAGAELETKKKSFSGAIILGLFAAAALIVGSIYILLPHNQQPSTSVTPSPAPAKQIVPEPQPTPLAAGQIVDLRPPQVSLLNPPVLGPLPAAAREPHMAQGEITLQLAAEGAKLAYPDGRTFILGHQLYSSASGGEASYAAEYGTWVIRTNALKASKSTVESKIQISGLADINGDGWPEVVLEDYSGGAHCCTSLIVLSLRVDGPAVVFAERLGSANAKMQDLDGDGRKEILTEHLFEYALGSFATGTFELPVAYSAGPDGVYHVNTREFKNWLRTGYEEERAKLSQSSGDPEQHDTELVNLFFLAYLVGQTNDAYSYLAQLEQIPGREHPLATLRTNLNQVAPEVTQEPPFQQLIAALHSGGPTEQTTSAAVQNAREPSSTPAPANTPISEPAGRNQPVSSASSTAPVLPAGTPTPVIISSGPAASATGSETAAGAYSGPTSGFIVWKGIVDKRGEISFDGSHVSTGVVEGGLPGVRVVINLDTKNYALVEYPSESNGWKHFKIRSKRKAEAIIIPWQIVK